MRNASDPQPKTEILKADSRGRVRTQAAWRQQLLAEYERSGLSAVRFTELHGINYQTFMGWRKKSRRPSIPAPAPVPHPDPIHALAADLGLREVVIEQPPVPPAPLEVEIAGDIRFRISNREQAHLAALFIRQLRGQA